MPDITPRLGLRRPLPTDPFLTSDFQFNADQLEKFPGIMPVLSTSLPSWGTDQAGMCILETDTGRIKRWTGAAFAIVEQYPRMYRGANETSTDVAQNTGATLAITGLNITPPRACNLFFSITCKFIQQLGTATFADVQPYVGGSNSVGGTSVGPVTRVQFGNSGTGAAGKASQFVTLFGSFAAAKGTAYQLQARLDVPAGAGDTLTLSYARGIAWLAE